jgi:hypothetical protein
MVMGLLLRPNRPLLRAAAKATTSRAVGPADVGAERSVDRGRRPIDGTWPIATRSEAASQPHAMSWPTTMQALLGLSRRHRAGELSDREFTDAVDRLIGA